jgi:hypothetical protein
MTISKIARISIYSLIAALVISPVVPKLVSAQWYDQQQNVYPYGQVPLSCSTPTPTVNLDQTAIFVAIGGSGVYTWATPTQTYQAIGPNLNVSFQSLGQQSVTVQNGTQLATCTVNVVASGAPATPPTYVSGPNPLPGQPVVPMGALSPLPADYPPQPGMLSPQGIASVHPSPSPAVTSQYVGNQRPPKLPNTGFAPIESWQVGLISLLLAVAIYFAAPYVRRAASITLG